MSTTTTITTMSPNTRSHRRRSTSRAFLAATALSSSLLLTTILAPNANAYPAPEGFADLAAKVTPAVVNISSTHKATEGGAPDQAMPFDFPKGSPFEELFRPFMEQQRQQHRNAKVTSLGSGFIVDSTGYIVTNNHVIDEATDIEVTTTDGKEYPAKLIGTDTKTDLALLKIEAKQPLPSVSFGDSDKERAGDWIMAVGNPFPPVSSRPAAAISMPARSMTSCSWTPRSIRAIPVARPSPPMAR